MEDYRAYEFKIGKPFRYTDNAEPERYLEKVYEAEAWIRQFQKEDKDGIYWSIDENKPIDFSFCDGISGLAYFYLELGKATKNEEYTDIGLKASQYLARNWRKTLSAKGFFDSPNVELNIASGTISLATVLLQTYRNYKRDIEEKALREIADEILSRKIETGGEITWTDDPTLLFDGGIELFFIALAETLDSKEYDHAIVALVDHILSKEIRDERGGSRWENLLAGYTLDKRPNFELGTAGVGYILSRAYEYTHDVKYLEAAERAAKNIRAISVRRGRGILVPYRDEPTEGLIFYVATCHGPAGTSKLFYNLYKLTGKTEYLETIDELYEGLRAIGVPERQSAGYWNNTCICCGTAGTLQFFLNYYNVSGERKSLEAAIKAGNILLSENEKRVAGRTWPLAFTRVTPEKISETYAYNNGSSGIASALLQLYLTLTTGYKYDKLIDDPYPQKAI